MNKNCDSGASGMQKKASFQSRTENQLLSGGTFHKSMKDRGPSGVGELLPR